MLALNRAVLANTEPSAGGWGLVGGFSASFSRGKAHFTINPTVITQIMYSKVIAADVQLALSEELFSPRLCGRF